MRNNVHYKCKGMQLHFHLLGNLCWWRQHFGDVNTLRDWSEECKMGGINKETICLLFKNSLFFFFSSLSSHSILQPYFWWLQPYTETESFSSSRSHLICFVVQLGHSISLPGVQKGDPHISASLPGWIPSQQKDLSCTYWKPGQLETSGYSEMLAANVKKGEQGHSSSTWLR